MALTDASSRQHGGAETQRWRPPSPAELFDHPLPHLGLLDRGLMRSVGYVVLSWFSSVSGLEHVAGVADPFILALNHASRFEALALPALLVYTRGGRRVHFVADWNFQMIPGIGLLYRRSGAIVVTRKPARPRFLNVLKPLFAHPEPSHRRIMAHLKAGHSVAIFAEGTVNRDPKRLLRGRLGTARLSLEAGVAVVPAGIRLAGADPERPSLDLRIGAPLLPPRGAGTDASVSEVRGWHATIMTEIARLSGKSWEPSPQEPRYGTP